MMQEEYMTYEAPMVEIIEVEIEKGFANSNPDDFDWGGPLS